MYVLRRTCHVDGTPVCTTCNEKKKKYFLVFHFCRVFNFNRSLSSLSLHQCNLSLCQLSPNLYVMPQPTPTFRTRIYTQAATFFPSILMARFVFVQYLGCFLYFLFQCIWIFQQIQQLGNIHRFKQHARDFTR